MSFTSPRSWSSTESLSAAHLNTYLRDNLNFLFSPPGCRVFHSTSQSISAGAGETALAFNGEQYDTNTMHDTATNNSRITFNTAGKYYVFGCVAWQSSTVGFRTASIRLNGTTLIVRDNKRSLGTHDTNVSCVYNFSTGDYIELTVAQTSTAALNVLRTANYSPEFGAQWQGD